MSESRSVNLEGRDERGIPGIGAVLTLVAVATSLAFGAWWSRPVRIGPDRSRLDAAVTLPDMRLELNRVDASSLTVLPGIGPALAGRIVDDRDRLGRFASIDDLTRVDGIGPATIERVRRYVIVE